MQLLGLTLRSKGSEGEPIPPVFRQLEAIGARIRRGQLTLIAAAPGGGKSAIATFIAMNAVYHEDTVVPVPTLYFSADSDKMTFGSRALAAAMRVKVTEAEELILRKDEHALGVLDRSTGHMWVNFDDAPSCRDISDEVDAFAYVYGDYPHIIVIDNLMDVTAGGSDERSSHDAVLNFAKQLARRTSAAVLVLCHVTGQYTDGNDPIPRSGLINKIDKRPRLILTLYRAGTNQLGVCVVKNSTGRAAADGSLMVPIPWIPESSWFGVGE